MKTHFGFSIGVGGSPDHLRDITHAAVTHLRKLGVDQLIVQIDNGFQIQSQPALASGAITADDIRRAARAVRDAGMAFIPLYNCIGHQGWKARNSLLRAYPEFDETPNIADDAFFLPCRHADGSVDMLDVSPGWCMNEPKVFDIILPVLDELAEAAECQIMHLGMDEIFWFGQCPRCRDLPADQLFFSNFSKLYEHLKSRGLGTMIWADRLLDARRLLGQDDPQRRWWDYDTYGAAACLPRIPKDVIACNWHYEVEDTYPSTGDLIANGVYAYPSCWKNVQAAEALWRDSKRQARALGCEEKLYGLLATCWGSLEHGLTGMFETAAPSETEQSLLAVLRCASELVQGDE